MITIQNTIDSSSIITALRDALDSDDVEFYYNSKNNSTLFPLVVIQANINESVKLCLKMVCSADSVWRGYYRDIIFKNLRVYSVCLLDLDGDEHAIDVKKSEIKVSDFIIELANYLKRVEEQKKQDGEIDFIAWKVDSRELNA